MKFHSVRIGLILITLTPTLTVGPTLAAPLTGLPASWVAHDLNIDLHNMPQRYSCDDLQRKFHDVLLLLGARPDLRVLATRCESGSRSPSVRLQFAMPELAQHTAKPGVGIEAAAAVVRLEPGHPGSLYAADCELMRQIKDRLLTPLSQHVVNFNLACSAAASRGARFTLSVQMLQPLDGGARMADDRALPLKQLN
jgi:hypothetical protein